MQGTTRKRRGGIVLEILLAAVILAVLVAVAVPRYERSLVRSRVSVMKSKLRQVALALEAYQADNLAYPLVTYSPFTHPDGQPFTPIELYKVYPGTSLTTPVPYLPDRSPLMDEFRARQQYDSFLPYEIMYLPSAIYQPPYYSLSNPSVYRSQVLRYGMFVLRSAGPDGYFQNQPGREADYGSGGWNLASYDPTNGTRSSGDIYRSQKDPEAGHN